MVIFPPSFEQNDVKLLQTGTLADGTVNCQGRSWKVHRALLASRLNFFRAAFCGEFEEAKSGAVNFPEADPDSVDIMLRHLYREALNVAQLTTPVLCVRCWKLADYVQLDSLKGVAMESLKDHLDAMALLASNDMTAEHIKPKWMGYFFDAFQHACANGATKSLQTEFVTFLWVTRFEMLHLPRTLDFLKEYPDVNKEILKLLVRNSLSINTYWFPDMHFVEEDVQNRKDLRLHYEIFCSHCGKMVKAGSEPRFYNPFPVHPFSRPKFNIGQLIWCKECADWFNQERNWPWRPEASLKGGKVKLEAWTWSRSSEEKCQPH